MIHYDPLNLTLTEAALSTNDLKITKVVNHSDKRTLHLVELNVSEDLGYLKRLKLFLTSIMNDQEHYLINKKLLA